MNRHRSHTAVSSTSFSPAELQRALERFDWIIDEVRDEVCRADVEGLREVLCDEDARTSAKERALVTLGLLATAHAEAALRWWESAGEHPRVRLLRRLARRECMRRRWGASATRAGHAAYSNERRSDVVA